MVANEKLDTFMKLSGELIVLKNSLRQICTEFDLEGKESKQFDKILESSQALNKITDALQEQIMDVRRVKIGQAFTKLPRMVRQTSKKLNKKVKLEIIGSDLFVDKNISRVLSGSMTHLIRNSVDHGIETPAAREMAGKPKEGNVLVKASQKNEKVTIDIIDDGKGIDRNIIANKAVSKGLISAEKSVSMSDSEVFDLIFFPGFSTAEVVTDVSGRGVGMDVVKSDILLLNGKVTISSEVGKGTHIQIEIPVPKTVMVEKSIIAKAFDVHLAFPQISVAQVISGDSIHLIDFNGSWGFKFKDKTIPLIDLQEIYEDKGTVLDKKEIEAGSVVVTFYKHMFVGVFVNQIKDQLEAVIRPFNKIVGELRVFKERL
ncbi:MAG: ATP-binding protein [Bdellovibrionales bacterium]